MEVLSILLFVVATISFIVGMCLFSGREEVGGAIALIIFIIILCMGSMGVSLVEKNKMLADQGVEIQALKQAHVAQTQIVNKEQPPITVVHRDVPRPHIISTLSDEKVSFNFGMVGNKFALDTDRGSIIFDSASAYIFGKQMETNGVKTVMYRYRQSYTANGRIGSNLEVKGIDY